jgi:hypothetical protein
MVYLLQIFMPKHGTFFSSIYATHLAYLILFDSNFLIIFVRSIQEYYGALHYSTVFSLLVLHPP